MNKFLINIIVAIVWGGLTGEFTLGNLVIGFIIGYLILLLSFPITGSSDFSVNFLWVFGLALFFFIYLFSSSMCVNFVSFILIYVFISKVNYYTIATSDIN